MKKYFKLIIFSILVYAFIISAFASPIVSPALNIIAKNNKMIKSGLVYGDIYFSEQDFMKCLGVTKIESVTIESLPTASDGALKLGTLSVTEGQTINSEYLSLLRFVPASDKIVGAEVIFSSSGTEIPCVLKFIEEVNYAPTFASDYSNVRTYCNVSCYGSVSVNDPDGDITDLQIVSYPEHGSLSILNPTRGSFKYTPSNNFIGKDEFVIVAQDNFGNYSPAQKIKVSVEKNGVFFTDIMGHWCENAAISLYEAGALEAVEYQEGMMFCPDDSITREEFVTMAMKALGATTLTESNTSFYDNSSIDVKFRPYVATAVRMGYINGKEIAGKMCFEPKENITKAEAAVVINNILGYEEGGYVTTFADDGAIPAWAKGAVYALTSAGVFNGDGEGKIEPSALLSRAQTVQMIHNVLAKK